MKKVIILVFLALMLSGCITTSTPDHSNWDKTLNKPLDQNGGG